MMFGENRIMNDIYKQRTIEEMPKDWQIKKIGEIATEIYRYPTYYNIEYQKKGIPEIRGELIKENGSLENDLSKYRYISPETSNRFSKTVLEESDFVISVRGTMGKVAMVPKSLKGANITANLMKISFNRNECYSAFLKQIFLSKSFKNKLNNLSSNTTIKTIQVPILKSIKIKLPPISEQQKIAEILSTVDEGIQKIDEIMRRTERLKKGLVQNLLTNGIGHKEFKETKLGKMPKDWQIKKIGEIATEIYRYPTYYNIEYQKKGILLKRSKCQY